jgi:hypothetical protein
MLFREITATAGHRPKPGWARVWKINLTLTSPGVSNPPGMVVLKPRQTHDALPIDRRHAGRTLHPTARPERGQERFGRASTGRTGESDLRVTGSPTYVGPETYVSEPDPQRKADRSRRLVGQVVQRLTEIRGQLVVRSHGRTRGRGGPSGALDRRLFRGIERQKGR